MITEKLTARPAGPHPTPERGRHRPLRAPPAGGQHSLPLLGLQTESNPAHRAAAPSDPRTRDLPVLLSPRRTAPCLLRAQPGRPSGAARAAPQAPFSPWSPRPLPLYTARVTRAMKTSGRTRCRDQALARHPTSSYRQNQIRVLLPSRPGRKRFPLTEAQTPGRADLFTYSLLIHSLVC